MGELQSKRFDEPDEFISHPRLQGQIVLLGETYVGRYIHHPGWRWSTDMKPLVGTPSCQYHHQGVVVSGYMQVTTAEGAQRVLGPGEAFDIPPGHDARVLGEEPFVSIEFLGVRDWARPRTSEERVLATLLFTDIVGSTAIAARLGDAAWKQLLTRHFDRVRLELDRFRGYELKTTGDGFLAMFDGTVRAVHCATAICKAAGRDGLEVRAGVHSGEVERYVDKVEGVAVHVAARIMALAGPGEVWLSASTASLLEGADMSLLDLGEHELKGLEGRRRLYRLSGDSAE
ncbi:MAG TPA: adenylate/guanylate cyclase domain-containing protein [Anaerolineales bacterium]|nr:adenylate/guanylate cyclase domain-containing protein [Anaerolineales bacterium]